VSPIAVLILAAGKGTRMPADLPKVLRRVAGMPLLAHVVRTARTLDPARILLVLGHRAEEVRAAFPEPDLEVVLQPDPCGTGDAVRRAEAALRGFDGDVLVLYGDVPLVRAATLRELIERHALEENAATLLTASLEDASGYGRIVRDEMGFCRGVVEQRELAPGQEAIREFNSGIAIFRAGPLFAALARIRPAPRTGEYYLTDVFALLRGEGERIGTSHLADPDEILGVNTPEQLRRVEETHAGRPAGPEVCELCRLAAGAPAGGCGTDPGATLLLGSGERVLVRANGEPFNSGHLMLFPRRHVTQVPMLDPAEVRELADWLRRGETLLRDLYGCEATNVGCASGAGEHLVFHLVPRWRGDVNFLALVARLKIIPDTPRRSWERLREAMR
jgi:CTP:molybdopterin cytidylyltransferase MocA/diadenosine tetraphosphate (Ap4A) HIT family hydrolase